MYFFYGFEYFIRDVNLVGVCYVYLQLLSNVSLMFGGSFGQERKKC